MTMVLCDTNILIEIYRRNIAIHAELEKIGHRNIAISDITCAELFYGARNKSELQKIRKDISQLTTLPIQTDISAIGVGLVESYCLSHRMDIEDALIAATAIYHNVPLFTLNKKDFVFIPDVRLYQYSV